MKKLLLWLIPCYMMAQNTAIYPNRAITINDLTVAVNNFKTQLTSNIDAVVTSLPVQNATGATVPLILVIGGTEAVLCTGKTQTSFTGCTRGFDNTVAVPHSRRDAVANAYIAFHYNQPAAEMIAVQADLLSRLETTVLLGTIRGALSATSPLLYNPGTGEFTCPGCGVGGSGITVSNTDPVCDTVGKQWIDTTDPGNTPYNVCLQMGTAFTWVGYSQHPGPYQIPQTDSGGVLTIPGGVSGQGSSSIVISSVDPVCDTVGKQWIDMTDPDNTPYKVCLKMGANFAWVGYSQQPGAYQIPQTDSNGFLTIPAGVVGGQSVAFGALGTAVFPNIVTCSDCTAGSTPCTGSGSGAYAFATAAGTWSCPF